MARVVSFPNGSGDFSNRDIPKHHLGHNRILLLCQWLHSLIHITIPASDLVTCLRDGVVLCKSVSSF
ncbi:hypothetical protein BCR43DRAFT_487769 [Syncephalastrum racemosum]|uniref:Uncharacterized protein n=1 Tax=Syncephalastrum racemosum TaxID=13706 RepID=A0A1X2HHP0_SYNRA|nr:hypothetical protein BCR43DRAFT_487769 [Syncephalastrum racemosum]